MTTKEFLIWIYERLVNVYRENPNIDYMIRLKTIIDSLEEIIAWKKNFPNILEKARSKANRRYPSILEIDDDAEFGEYDINEAKREIFIGGYLEAGKDLCWHSVDDCLPEVDEEVIVLTDDLGTAPIYKIAFGHIVDKERCLDYNGWNIPGVRFWMPCPEIPKEVEK